MGKGARLKREKEIIKEINMHRMYFQNKFLQSQLYNDLLYIGHKSGISTEEIISDIIEKGFSSHEHCKRLQLQMHFMAMVIDLGYCLDCFMDYHARKQHNISVDDRKYQAKYEDVIYAVRNYDDKLIVALDYLNISRCFIDDNGLCDESCLH